MIKLTRKGNSGDVADSTLTLPLHSRIKSRQRVTLDDGRVAGLFLERGSTLKEGDLLLAEDGYRVRIVASPEKLSVIRSRDPHLLARACYHLGNRHVPVQIEAAPRDLHVEASEGDHGVGTGDRAVPQVQVVEEDLGVVSRRSICWHEGHFAPSASRIRRPVCMNS